VRVHFTRNQQKTGNPSTTKNAKKMPIIIFPTSRLCVIALIFLSGNTEPNNPWNINRGISVYSIMDNVNPHPGFSRPSLLRRASSAAILFLASCSAVPGIRGYCTPQEAYQNAGALNGRMVTVRGKVEIISSACTLEACPPGNPCCNGCYHQLGFRVDGQHVLRLAGEDSGCSGNSCSSRCPLFDPSRTYAVTGVLTDGGANPPSLEMDAWRIVG
jgi:hypothetical protein